MAATCRGRVSQGKGPVQPPPPSLPSLNCCSLQGVQALASAPGFVERREEGPWPPCTCSGPCRTGIEGLVKLGSPAGLSQDCLASFKDSSSSHVSQALSTGSHTATSAKHWSHVPDSESRHLSRSLFLFLACAFPILFPPGCLVRESPVYPTTADGAPPTSHSPHLYTSARMLSIVATSGWQWPELRSRSSKA